MKYIDTILASQKTVFTYRDIQTILWIDNKETIKSYFTRWVKSGIFKRIYKWIYTLANYNTTELANKVKTNSYVSFETVLKKEWIIFQDYGDTIFSASDQTIQKKIWTQRFVYLKIKDSILLNPLWLINTWSYTIASAERAICDRLYLSPEYYFDNLEHIDLVQLVQIAQIYNKRVVLAINTLIQHAQQR
jgi:hypothetical protein